MSDLISFILGILFGFVIVWTVIEFLKFAKPDTPISPEIANNIVGETPYCPDCGSHSLTLVDEYANVPWLKGHVAELDRYRCNKCKREFNDENWKDAKKYV